MVLLRNVVLRRGLVVVSGGAGVVVVRRMLLWCCGVSVIVGGFGIVRGFGVARRLGTLRGLRLTRIRTMRDMPAVVVRADAVLELDPGWAGRDAGRYVRNQRVCLCTMVSRDEMVMRRRWSGCPRWMVMCWVWKVWIVGGL